MKTVRMIPNLEETLRSILSIVRSDHKHSSDIIRAEALVNEIDTLRSEYNMQLDALRARYGNRIIEAVQELRQIASKSRS